MKAIIKFHAVSFLLLFMSLSAFAQVNEGNSTYTIDMRPTSWSGFTVTLTAITSRVVHSIKMPDGYICTNTNSCTRDIFMTTRNSCEYLKCYASTYTYSFDKQDGCTVIIGPNGIEDIQSGDIDCPY